jgi:hypothetical protein
MVDIHGRGTGNTVFMFTLSGAVACVVQENIKL